MIKFFIQILIIAVLTGTQHAQDNSETYPLPTFHPNIYYPITAEYYQQFITSEVEFSKIEIRYNLSLSSECLDVPEQRLFLESNYDFTDEMYWVDMPLNELEFFIGHFFDIDQHFYCTGYAIDDDIMPIFQIIQSDLEYYCNAEEFSGEDSVEFINPWEMGVEFNNYIMFTIYPPDIKFNTHPPLKAFIKGWNPCDDPPEELMPLINYMEDVILPIARRHPF